MAPKTSEKIAFLYGKQALETYAREVEPEVLPVGYGGSNRDEHFISAEPAPWEKTGRRVHKY